MGSDPARRLAAIVEGHGETASFGVLARRLLPAIEVLPPLRIKRQRIVRSGEIERAVEFAARKLGGVGGVVVLLDADRDCPAELGPALLARARAARADVSTTVVLAKPELEAWFVAALESLRGQRNIPWSAHPPASLEDIQNPKVYLSRLMGRRYHEPTDQPALAAAFDMDLAARRSPSFAKLRRDLASMFPEP
jgi:hypothetical protein